MTKSIATASINRETAVALIDAAITAARAIGIPAAVAVVDATGNGSVANSRGLAELLILGGNAGLCGEDGELLGEGRIWIEGESRLSFAHHVNHFDAG